VQDSIVKAVNDSPMIVPTSRAGEWGRGRLAVDGRDASGDGLLVADGRGYDEACEVISPEYSGVMVRDGWAPYRSFTKATHQTCCATCSGDVTS